MIPSLSLLTKRKLAQPWLIVSLNWSSLNIVNPRKRIFYCTWWYTNTVLEITDQGLAGYYYSKQCLPLFQFWLKFGTIATLLPFNVVQNFTWETLLPRHLKKFDRYSEVWFPLRSTFFKLKPDLFVTQIVLIVNLLNINQKNWWHVFKTQKSISTYIIMFDIVVVFYASHWE